MTIDEFRASVSAADPPAVSAALRALWHDARGDWNAAHTVAQAIALGPVQPEQPLDTTPIVLERVRVKAVSGLRAP